MKSTGMVLGILVGLALLARPTAGDAQTKENFEKSRTQKTGVFTRMFSNSESASRKPANYRKHMDHQRLHAEAIAKQQAEFRTEQRKKQLNRKPTAWEKNYAKQEKKNRKELRKIMRERDQRLQARAKSKRKAMAAMVRYNKKKTKQQPVEQNTLGREHFSAAASDATAAGRKR